MDLLNWNFSVHDNYKVKFSVYKHVHIIGMFHNPKKNLKLNHRTLIFCGWQLVSQQVMMMISKFETGNECQGILQNKYFDI